MEYLRTPRDLDPGRPRSATCSAPVGPTCQNRGRLSPSVPSFRPSPPAPTVRFLARSLIHRTSHSIDPTLSSADRRVESIFDLPNRHSSRSPLQRPPTCHISSLKLRKRFNPLLFPLFFSFPFSVFHIEFVLPSDHAKHTFDCCRVVS